MKNIFLLSLLFCGVNTKAQTSLPGHLYSLEGKIVNTVIIPPACGRFAFATVIEFKIIQFSDSSYSLKYIPIIFTCPEDYGKNFFKVGSVYQIDIGDKNPGNDWILINKKALIKYHLKKELWALTAKRI